MLKYCIIIPCFNEEKRILTDEFLEFAETHPNCNFLFVDDGSIDQTSQVINYLSNQSNQIEGLILESNFGKAEAIRQGMLSIVDKKHYDCLGYLDADLAIPFSELERLMNKLVDGFHFVFSSKKATADSELEIKFKRYFVGRVLSSMVRLSLKLKIYDTQCGCKLMIGELASLSFKEKFISSWLFDIELIWRIIIAKGRTYFKEKAIEIPVKRLIDRGSSRIKISDLFSLPFEFLKIHSYYSKLKRAK